MTLTLLLDLDDTLLTNNMNTFLPAYFQSLANHMSSHANPTKFISILTTAAEAMIANDRPDRTLKETFEAAFYPSLGIDAQQVKESIDIFYHEVFPTLQPLADPRPEAVQLIENALERNFQLVIATNPLFPRTAIEERMKWAGISPQDHPVNLITSYETFHFSKPHPAYYAEILARLGWPKRATVMVGDDFENDIQPARRLGIPAFWIKPNSSFNIDEHNAPPLVSGWLDQVIPWLDTTPTDQLQPSINTLEAYLAVLKSTPACLATILAEIPIQSWKQSPLEGEWCLTEILCHLRDVEKEVNLPRIKNIIQESNPFLTGIDTDAWANERQYIIQDGPLALTEFIQARLEQLKLLSSLSQADLNQPARHAIFGPTKLFELVGINASHDRVHIQQIHQILNHLNKHSFIHSL